MPKINPAQKSTTTYDLTAKGETRERFKRNIHGQHHNWIAFQVLGDFNFFENESQRKIAKSLRRDPQLPESNGATDQWHLQGRALPFFDLVPKKCPTQTTWGVAIRRPHLLKKNARTSKLIENAAEKMATLGPKSNRWGYTLPDIQTNLLYQTRPNITTENSRWQNPTKPTALW